MRFVKNKDDWYRIKIKNKFFKNEDIEIISPSEKFVTQVTEIKTQKGEELELANTKMTICGLNLRKLLLIIIMH